MLNLKKEAKPVIEVGELKIGICPACSAYISHIYFMEDAATKKKSKWYSCACGIIWQSENPKGMNPKYGLEGQKLIDVFEYPVRIYSPIIEELIYGRKVLLIGHDTSIQEKYFSYRGWFPSSIDKSFEIQEFERMKFNMIWAYHSFESFLDPIKALLKMRELLTEDGILFLASPDTDFIHTRGSSGFRHWKPDQNYLMWNRRAITKQLESLGFNIIMARQNADMRFPETDDFHLIAQKKYF